MPFHASKEYAKRPLRKIVVVFKTHFDLGFTDLPDNVMSLYTGPMFSAVRGVMAATSQEPDGLRYAWTLPSWPLDYLLHDERVPADTRAAAHDLVGAGRLHWHAWPFTTHTAFCGLEEMVRGLHISRTLSEEFGRWPTSAKQTDVPGHTWITPTLLARAGVKFLHLGVNPGSHSPHVPTLFWWEGPDGSRLLTWYSHGGYGSSLLPPDDWPLDTWLAVLLTVENTGPQSPEELQRIRASIEQGAPGVEVIFGQLDDFANAAFETQGQLDDLPVVPYDLADTWIHGIGTMPREVARVRALRSKLLELECIAAGFQWPGSAGYRKEQPDFPLLRQISTYIDEAYKQMLLFGEHTWGLDVKSTIKRAFGSEFLATRQTEPYRRLEASWLAKGEYVTRAEEAYARAEALVRESWRGWSETPESQAEYRKWDELIKAESYRVAPRKISKTSNPPIVLEKHSLRLEVDPASGGIISLRDAETGREWVDQTNPEPFGGYRYDLYSAADIGEYIRAYGTLFQDWFVHDQGKTGYPESVPHVTAYARDFKVSQVTDEQGESLLLTGGTLKATTQGADLLPAQRVSIRVTPGTWTTTFSAAPYILLDYTIQGKEATPLAESTVVPFPLNLPKPTFRVGQVGSVIDPARDIAEGANRNLWCADWVDVSDDRVGMAVLPVDMPLLSVGNTGIYRFEPERALTESIVYAHLSNTQWGTNFPQWLEGDFHFQVILIFHKGDWRAGNVWEFVRYPDLGDLRPVGERGVSDLSLCIKLPEGLVLQSIKPRHKGRGLIARYWDALGMPRRETLTLFGPIEGVWRCDLMERPSEQLHIRLVKPKEGLSVSSTYISTHIAPHAIETLLIEFKDE